MSGALIIHNICLRYDVIVVAEYDTDAQAL